MSKYISTLQARRVILPTNFCVQLCLFRVQVSFSGEGSHKLCRTNFPWSWSAAFYLKIFARNCPCDMSMRIRRRKLAQSPLRESSLVWVCGILPENSTIKIYKIICVTCLNSKFISAARVCTKWLSRTWVRHFGGKFLRKHVFVEILANSANSFPRGRGMILHRSFTENLMENLVGSSLRDPFLKILQTPCGKAIVWKLISVAVEWFLSHDLLRPARAAEGPFMTTLWVSLWWV